MIAHLAACTVTALIALAAVLAMRGQRAAWRHAILFLALIRFAIPTGWLAGAGEKLVRVAPAPRVRAAAGDLRWLLRGPGFSSAPGTRTPGGPRYEGVWGGGILVCLALWSRRVWRRIPGIRPASELELECLRRAANGVAVDLRIVAAGVTPGAWGWLRGCILLPDGLSMQLNAVELEAVLSHEIAHVRRRDNLIAAAAHAIASVFWFHPLVWWIERRMLVEREAACDEMVLARGASAQDYAAGILKVCQAGFAGAAGYAGVTGSNLGNRMEYIMSLNPNRRPSAAARALLAACFTIAVMLPVAGGYLKAQENRPPESGAFTEQFKRGVDLLQQKRYAEADQAFRDAQEIDSNSSRALMGQVEVRMSQNKWQEALELLQNEVNRHPKRVDLRLALGNTAVRCGQYDLAIATFQALLGEVDHDNAVAGDIYLRLGETYRRKGDMEAAITTLQKARATLPNHVVVTNTLALVLEASGRNQEAESEYRAVLKLDPKNGIAMNNLAYLITQRGGDLDEALTFGQRARQMLPDVDETQDTLGWIYLKKGLVDQAVSVFDKLVHKQPDKAEFRYHLALALAEKGDKFAATQQLTTALTCKPTEAESKQITDLLEKIRGN